MDPRIVGLMANQHGLITYTQARKLGMDDREIGRLVRRGGWRRVRRGVFVATDHWESLDVYRGRPLLAVRAAHMVIQRKHWFSHESAALIQGIPLADPSSAGVHVTRPRVLGDRSKAGIVHHKAVFLPSQATTVDGLPVLGLARTACDLARGSGLTAGIAACDHVLRRGVTIEDLTAVRRQMAYWRGVKNVERSIDLADPGAENFAESAMRELIEALGIGHPFTQFGLRAEGRTVYCDVRVGRHVFEMEGKVKFIPVAEGGVASVDPTEVAWAQRERDDFITGFKLGISHVTTAISVRAGFARWSGFAVSTPTRWRGSVRTSATSRRMSSPGSASAPGPGRPPARPHRRRL
ncbi:MAG TPA: type IV toxin-antitoxin system AbiEi family antitoxin domain-containing protein [Nocardioides sp.]|uniref:type IV toxin-antitoxin system AbiEi family antitoxin domain-containing protein n=1 Tax=Nocardioides sp. TaxID=35761 RepID=UPI002F3ECF16